MSERRYTDEEVQRILASAVESDARPGGSAASGMTLAEIQSIAQDAGVSVASVTAAAAAIDRAPVVPTSSRMLGLPVGVGSTVPLPRPLDDTEWQRLVVFLRDTFEARGRVETVAGQREWRNGNLRISIETIGDTAVLQMRTYKGNARRVLGTGLALLSGAVVGGAVVLVGHAGPVATTNVLTIAAVGATMTGIGAIQLPGWSSARRKQFAAVAEYTRRLTEGEDATPRLSPG